MVDPLDCPPIESWQALLDFTLPADQLERFEHHLQSCPACQERLDQIPEGEEELRRCARRFGDPTAVPADPTLFRFLERMHEGCASVWGPVEPAELYFLSPSNRPDVLGLLGDYEVQEVIGQGGMGIVLRAYEPALNRLVAVKVLAAAVAGSAAARRRFSREARAAAAVCHENIVAVYGVHEIDCLPYLVMQYIAGESLQNRLDRDGPLAAEEVVHIGMQTASGLAAAHALGLIHRDIKPANLLLENGLARVKITDFGLARMADDVQLTQAGVAAGTPEYMAPEQARGERGDHRSDLFSLGSVLYACAAGRPPFRGPTPLALLHAVNEHTPTPLCSLNPNLPAWLESFIARLMAKDPVQRFQSAAEVATLLQGFLDHLRQPDARPAPTLPAFADVEPVGRQSPLTHPLHWFWRRPFTFIAALLLLGVLAGVGGALGRLLIPPSKQIHALAQTGNAPAGQAEPYAVWSPAVSSNGKLLAAGAGWWTTTGEVGVWDLATHKPLAHFAADRGVGSVALSPDGKLLAFGIWGGRVRVLDWAAGKEVADLQVNGFARVAFSPDGALLATASEGQALQLWNVAKGELATDLEGDLLRFHCVLFSPDGKRVLAGGGDWQQGGVNHVGVWDVASKKQILKLAGHNNTVYCLACSPDGNLIATGSIDRTIRLWDAESGECLKTLRGAMRGAELIAFTADGKTLVSSGPDPIIRFWDVARGVETGQFDAQIPHLCSLALSPDGQNLVVGGEEKTLKIFNLETHKQEAVLWNDADQQSLDMDALPATDPPPAEEPRSHASLILLVVTLAAGLTAGLIVWVLARRRRPSGHRIEQPSAAPTAEQKPASISFTCSDCGAHLKAREALAGKKVKCSHCSRPVRVPAIQVEKAN